MTQHWNIAVGIDGSEKDEQAVRWAGQTAARKGGNVHVVYAVTVDGGAALDTSELDTIAQHVTGPAR